MSLPIGTILLWFGSVATIPAGFHLCDGTNSTPDLRDRFVVGAGNTYNPDDTGGSANHTHTFTSNGHTHPILAGAAIAAGANYSATTGSNVDTGTTNPGSSLPPYYALCYIMRI